jgi:hypothetical protein
MLQYSTVLVLPTCLYSGLGLKCFQVLFGWLAPSQPAVLFSHTSSAPATSQPAVFFSHNKSASATSQPNEL